MLELCIHFGHVKGCPVQEITQKRAIAAVFIFEDGIILCWFSNSYSTFSLSLLYTEVIGGMEMFSYVGCVLVVSRLIAL